MKAALELFMEEVEALNLKALTKVLYGQVK